MLGRWILCVLALTLLVPAAPSQAAETMHPHLERTQGTFEAGLAGAGKLLFPSFLDAPDHERISFPVNPCHRQLSLGLDYEPRNASLQIEEAGYGAHASLPYRFQAGLIAPNGTLLHRITIDEPDASIPFGVVEEPGTYTLELELLEGAMVDWEVRVRGFAVHEDPSCDLWLNEVELSPTGPGAGWVELYNEASLPVDVSGWHITAQQANHTHTIADGTELAAGGYERIDLPTDALDETGETVALLGPSQAPLDASASLTDDEADERTWQKQADGLGDWIFAPGTPEAPNAGP